MEYDAKILDTDGIYSLVAWEGRRFPGLLMQGDSLSILLATLQEAASELRNGDVEDASFAVGEAVETVGSMIEAYERMMAACGRSLPYWRESGTGDVHQ
ncbi:hypothetical protein AB0H49_23360 [Nocardia sp. NPDC050713]|uniref:DUF6959 family protein n=1 Tax=Nocardia sp. NPDC050713 TaxID=3154511 RepID=UPI0034028E77